MKQNVVLVPALLGTLLLSSGLVSAADPVPDKSSPRAQQQDEIYGNQMMTPDERTDYRAKMRATKTTEEREQLRVQHHQQMLDRAKERGVNLPAEPPARGRGQTQGGSGMPGGGMYQGGGVSPGGGMGGGGMGGGERR